MRKRREGSNPSFSVIFRPVGQVVKTLPFHGSNMGSNPVRVIFPFLILYTFILWRITQVRLKGTVLKTVRWVKPRVGSNPTSSFFIIAGWSSLVARRAHNPKVVGSNPSPAILVPWCRGYHACLSRRRSPVQIRLGPSFSQLPFGSFVAR